MKLWKNRLLVVAVVLVLAVGSYLAVDLYLRQLAFANCMRQLEALDVRRVEETPSQGTEHAYRTYVGLDAIGRGRWMLLFPNCELCRQRVKDWPR